MVSTKSATVIMPQEIEVNLEFSFWSIVSSNRRDVDCSYWIRHQYMQQFYRTVEDLTMYGCEYVYKIEVDKWFVRFVINVKYTW